MAATHWLPFAHADSPAVAPTLTIDHQANVIAKAMTLGHTKQFQQTVERVMNRLSLGGDYKDYTVKLIPSPIPNAAIKPGIREVHVNVGLLSWCKSEDELAAVIAHEMTHANPSHMRLQRENRAVDEILARISGYAGLEPAQQEEVRADLGAMERLIRGGYNPWAHHEFQKRIARYDGSSPDVKLIRKIYARIFESSFDFISTHPSSEIRMEAAVQYLFYADRTEGLSNYAKTYTPFSRAMKRVRAAIRPYTGLIMSNNVPRAMMAWSALSVAAMAGIGDQVPILQGVSEVVNSVNQTLASPLLVASDWIAGDLLHSSSGPADSNAAYHRAQRMFYASLAGGLAGISGLIAWAVHDSIALLPNHHSIVTASMSLAAAQKKYNQYRRSKNAHPKTLISLLYETNEIGAHIGDAYQQPGLRRFDFLTYLARDRRWLCKLQAQIINDIAANIADKFSEMEMNELIKYLGQLPPYAYEDSRSESALLRIAQYSQHTHKENAFFKRVQLRGKLKQIDQLPVSDQIDLVGQLMDEKMVDSAIAVVTNRHHAMFEYVWSSHNTSPQRTAMLEQVAQAALTHGTLKNTSLRTKRIWQAYLAKMQLRTVHASAAEKMPLRSLAQRVRHDMPKWAIAQRLLAKGDRVAFRQFLARSFDSVTDLVDWIDTQVVPKNIVIKNFTDDLYALIVAHPQWIKTQGDIDKLFETAYFWPEYDHSIQVKGVEAELLEVIKDKGRSLSTLWQYDPGKAEILHRAVVAQMAKFKQMPTTFEAKLALFKTLTRRGITATSDHLFAQLYETADATQKQVLASCATDEHLVWEPQLRVRVAREKLRQSAAYKSLPEATDTYQRRMLLNNVFNELDADFPERGIGYMEMLDELSEEIESTEEESARIAQKKETPGSKNSADFALRSLSAVAEEALSWSKQQQWELILYLRGDIEATPKLKATLRIVGPERIRRSFLLLPVAARTAVIHGLVASPRGLLPDVNWSRGYSQKIVKHLLRDAEPQTRQIAFEILDAFMYALGKVGAGKENYRSLLLAHLLAHPRDVDRRAGHLLKDVLEQFGTTGIKIGQFIAAAELLPAEDNEILRQLQNRALVPDRESIYRDFRKLAPHLLKQYRLRKRIGSASMKYVVQATDRQTAEDRALKVLREGAIAHTELEFDILRHMSDRLVQRRGVRYGVFRTIAKNSIAAVQREMSLPDEVRRSQWAKGHLYSRHSSDYLVVDVPEEHLVTDRIVNAQFAEGVSIPNLPPAYQQPMADALVGMESDILWNDTDDVIEFDPDRHFENNLTRVKPRKNGNVGVIQPIDLAQLQQMTSQDRSNILELISLAQVIKKVGVTRWSVNHAATVMNLTDAQRGILSKRLAKYFSSNKMSELAAYNALLAAIDETGHEVGLPYFDYARAIVQLEPYNRYISDGMKPHTARARLTAHVTARGEALGEQVKQHISTYEKFNYVRRNFKMLRKDFQKRSAVVNTAP